jgi:hypothetical protein
VWEHPGLSHSNHFNSQFCACTAFLSHCSSWCQQLSILLCFWNRWLGKSQLWHYSKHCHLSNESKAPWQCLQFTVVQEADLL